MQLLQHLLQLKRALKGRRPKPVDIKIEQLLNEFPKLDEENAATLFYPDSNFANRNFNRLKQKATDFLINDICAISPVGSRQLKVYSSVTKRVYIIRLMAATGLRSGFTSFAENTFNKAVRYHLTDAAISVCKELMMHYSFIQINSKKFYHYREQYQHLVATKEAELRAECRFFDVYHNLNLTKHIDDTLRFKIAEYIEDLREDFPNSYWYGYLKHNLEVVYSESKGEKDKVLEICTKALQYFEGLDFEAPPNVIRSFTLRTVPLLILKRNFEEAHKAIHRTRSITKEGSLNWVVTQQYDCILGFYSRNYDLCAQAIEILKKHSRQNSEIWLIYEAYLYLFQKLGKYEGKRFKLGKFLNEVPRFSKDKKGMNINILIIQILVLLKDRRWPSIVDRIDALKAYIYRHLKSESTLRSDTFLSMLAVLPKSAFQRDQVEARTAQLRNQLQQGPILSVDFEIVPYEDLWEFVLELLI